MGSKRKPNPLPKGDRTFYAAEEDAKACLFGRGDAITYTDSDEEPHMPGRITDVDPDSGEISVAWCMSVDEEREYLREMVLWHEKRNARLNSLVDILAEELFFLAAVSEVSEAAITFDDLLEDYK